MCQIDAPKVAVRLVSIRHAIWKLFQTIGRGVTNVPPPDQWGGLRMSPPPTSGPRIKTSQRRNTLSGGGAFTEI